MMLEKPKRARRAVLMRWVRARIGNEQTERRVLIAADAYAAAHMQHRNYRTGQLVSVDCKTARNPDFFRKAHKLASLVIENLDAFAQYVVKRDEHVVLKRLQIEGDICCDHILLDGGLVYALPQSLCFETMPEEEFQVFYTQLIDYIRRRYWLQLDAYAIEEMARFAGDAQ